MLNIIGEDANHAVKIRVTWFGELVADGFVSLQQWDRMREELNDILEEDNPIWVVNRAEYEQTTGENVVDLSATQETAASS